MFPKVSAIEKFNINFSMPGHSNTEKSLKLFGNLPLIRSLFNLHAPKRILNRDVAHFLIVVDLTIFTTLDIIEDLDLLL